MFTLAAVATALRGGDEFKFGRWGTFWHRFSIASWRWSVALCKFEDHWALHLFCLWVTLWKTREDPEEIMDSWGVSYCHAESALHLSWGAKSRIVWMPWMYDHCRTEVMLNDGSFVPYDRFPRRKKGEPFGENPEPLNRYRETLPYHYMLDSGEVQHRQATVTVERRSWCWRAWPFRVLRWPSMTRTSIDVQFGDEVGERAGSWKGGTVGCGYDLRRNETPAECLRRMQRERRFD